MLRADETPQQAKQQQAGNRVTGPDMNRLQQFAVQRLSSIDSNHFALGEPGQRRS
jgi:hypothetical protein